MNIGPQIWSKSGVKAVKSWELTHRISPLKICSCPGSKQIVKPLKPTFSFTVHKHQKPELFALWPEKKWTEIKEGWRWKRQLSKKITIIILTCFSTYHFKSSSWPTGTTNQPKIRWNLKSQSSICLWKDVGAVTTELKNRMNNVRNLVFSPLKSSLLWPGRSLRMSDGLIRGKVQLDCSTRQKYRIPVDLGVKNFCEVQSCRT